jgi:hypothetical protein
VITRTQQQTWRSSGIKLSSAWNFESFCKFVAFPLSQRSSAHARVCASKRDRHFQWPHTRETTNYRSPPVTSTQSAPEESGITG